MTPSSAAAYSRNWNSWGARPGRGAEKRSAPRAGQRRGGAVARRWRPLARILRDRTCLSSGASERRVVGERGQDGFALVLNQDKPLRGCSEGGPPASELPFSTTLF